MTENTVAPEQPAEEPEAAFEPPFPVPTTPLEPLPEDWERALVIAAHPDDVEYGAAAAIARWTGQGKQIVYCMVTSGEAGIDSMPPEQTGPLREKEERDAAAIVGVDVVEFLGYPDGVVEYGLPLRRDVARVIRRHRPDIVITGNFHDTFGGTMLNQADHIAVGKAVLDGARDAGNRWVFTELLDEGLEPWNKVRAIWAAGSLEANHGVDVTDTFELGVRSLEAHAGYLGALPGHPEPRDFLGMFARMTGPRLGVQYGSIFEVYPLMLY